MCFFRVLSQSRDCSYSSPPRPHAQTCSFMVFIFGRVNLPFPSVGCVRASGSCSRAVTVLWWMCRVSVSGEDPVYSRRAGESVFSLKLYHTGQPETWQQASSGPGEHISLQPPIMKYNLEPQCAARPRRNEPRLGFLANCRKTVDF